MRKAWIFFTVTLVLSVAVFFRFFRLGEVPVSLYWDEIAMLVDARAVAETGKDMYGNSMWQAIFPSYGDYKLPVYIWLASLSVKIFGASEWALRFPSALAGIGTVLLGFYLAKEFFRKNTDEELSAKTLLTIALCVMVVIAIAPWDILFSRTAFEGHIGQFLVSVSILMAFQQKKHWSWGVLSALLGGLATYTYFSVRFVWPVVFFMVTALFIWDSKKNWWKQSFLFFFLPLFVYFLSLQPMYRSPLYTASNQFRLSTTSVLNMQDWPVIANSYKLQAGNTLFDKITYHPVLLISRELVKNFSDNMSLDFLFLSGDPNLRHGTGKHGLFLWIFLPSFFYGWYSLFPKYWKQGLVLAAWWISALLPASVPETTPHALRSLNALMPLSLVIGWGSYQLFEKIQNLRTSHHLKMIFFASLFVMVSFSVFEFGKYLFTVYPGNSAMSWQAGYKELARIVWEEREGKDTIWAEPFDSRFYLWVMGYEMPVSDFKNIQFNQYVPATLGRSIAFRPFDWDNILTTEPKIIVAGQKKGIDEKLAKSPVQPTWYKTITIEDGSTPFAVVYFEK